MISIRQVGLMAALLVAVPALAGPLVVRAAGPSAAQFRPGQRLPDAPVTLKAGDSIVVLDAKGTRSFSGPGTFSLAAPSAAAENAAFSDLLVQKPARRARIGAVRATGQDRGPPTPPGVWTLDIRTSDTVCTLDPGNIALWRADTAAAQTLRVQRGDGVSAPLVFAAGQATAAMPAAVSGQAGTFTISGGKTPVTLTVKQLTAAANVDALGEALVTAGCDSQFARLAANTLQD